MNLKNGNHIPLDKFIDQALYNKKYVLWKTTKYPEFKIQIQQNRSINRKCSRNQDAIVGSCLENQSSAKTNQYRVRKSVRSHRQSQTQKIVIYVRS